LIAQYSARVCSKIYSISDDLGIAPHIQIRPKIIINPVIIPKMISIILAAGQGTRMRPLSYFIPKILLPVRGKPVLDYLIDNMKNVDIDHHYIVASEHVEIIGNYLEKTGMKNISTIRGLGWETGGDLSIAFEEVRDSDDDIVKI